MSQQATDCCTCDRRPASAGARPSVPALPYPPFHTRPSVPPFSVAALPCLSLIPIMTPGTRKSSRKSTLVLTPNPPKNMGESLPQPKGRSNGKARATQEPDINPVVEADTVLDNEVTEKQRKKVARLEKENAAMKVKIAKAKSNAGSNAGPSHERDTEDDIESEDFDVPANFLSSIRSLGVVSATPAKPLRPQQIGAASAPVPSSVDDKGLQTTPRPSAVDETAIELPAPPVASGPLA
ncbi:hypothetical protein BJV77DRAFT_967301 [Russula vinacea]|nr:hypothetical protein BJV77DRAFT_967301 [Russula vinacea]